MRKKNLRVAKYCIEKAEEHAQSYDMASSDAVRIDSLIGAVSNLIGALFQLLHVLEKEEDNVGSKAELSDSEG